MNVLALLEESWLGVWVRESAFGYPAVLISHTLGLALVVGSILVFDVAVLGSRSRLRIQWLEPLFRIAWMGFAINLISGVILFAGAAQRFIVNPMFLLKLGTIAAGAVALWLLARRIEIQSAGNEGAAIARADRALAILSLIFWASAIMAGRWMAYQ